MDGRIDNVGLMFVWVSAWTNKYVLLEKTIDNNGATYWLYSYHKLFTQVKQIILRVALLSLCHAFILLPTPLSTKKRCQLFPSLPLPSPSLLLLFVVRSSLSLSLSVLTLSLWFTSMVHLYVSLFRLFVK